MKGSCAQIDISGQKFGLLTAISRTRNAHGISAWLCKCECGAEKIVTVGSLKRDQTRSCGCAKPSPTAWSEHVRASVIKRRGFGHIRRDSWGYRVASGLCNRARKGGYSFGFSSLAECADYLISVAPTHCPVFNIPLIYDNAGRGANRWAAASVDKIDSSAGYVRGNIQVISYKANTMKQTATADELRAFAEWITKTWPAPVTQ